MSSEAELATLGTYNTTTSAESVTESFEGGISAGASASDSDPDSSRTRVFVSDLGSEDSSSSSSSGESSRAPQMVNLRSASKAVVSHEQAHPSAANDEDSLEVACQNGDLRQIDALLTSNNLNEGGLHHAASNNHWRACELLLSRGADVDKRLAPLNATPLLWASRNGHAYIVKLLADHGADPHAVDASGFAALHLAVQSSNVLMVVYIIHLEVDVDALDSGSRTPLHWAVVQGDHLSVEALLKAGASPNLADGEGTLPLYHSVYTSKSVEVTALLLQYGADPLAIMASGQRVVDLCNLSETWTQACVAAGRQPNGTPMRSRLFSPEVAKIVTTVLPMFILPLALSMPSLAGSTWLGVLLGAFMFWISKRFLERCVIPIAWPHAKPMLHSTLLAGLFAAFFICIAAYWFLYIAPVMLYRRPWVSIAICALIGMVIVCYVATLMMDPGVIEPKSLSQRLTGMNELMDTGLFDSVHLCIHTYVPIPLRGRYDHYVERVVCRYDHYCPWLYNAIGIRNHRAFLAFLLALTVGIPLVGFQLSEYSSLNGATPYALGLAILTLMQATWIYVLTLVQIFQVAKGTTSYELSHFRENNIYKTDPIRAFSSLPRDHPRAQEVLGESVGDGRSATSLKNHRGTGDAHHHHHHHDHHSKSRFSLCWKILGFRQLVVALRTLFQKSYWNAADNGLARNCMDFWCAGGSMTYPRGAEGAIDGITVDYYTLREFPKTRERATEYDQIMV